MIRYIRLLNGSLERSDIKSLKRAIYDDSVVDKSKFRPNVNDVHNFTGQGSQGTPLYDFPDGVDNGLRLGAMRSLGADITEINATAEQLKTTTQKQTDDVAEIVKSEITKLKDNLKNRQKQDVIKDIQSSNIYSDS